MQGDVVMDELLNILLSFYGDACRAHERALMQFDYCSPHGQGEIEEAAAVVAERLETFNKFMVDIYGPQ
jgi:hypothetical protein